MDEKIYNSYLAILKSELVVALGCTEPIAIAYAGAKARQILGEMPDSCIVSCSGNIVKNVKGVTVPNSGGLKGIEAAAVLGIVGGDPNRDLTVLETVTEQDVTRAKMLLAKGFCQSKLLEDIAGLYIIVHIAAGENTAEVAIADYH
ncbi:MAG: serine dehydratase subunit alpha family protein, partial [Sporomusa sp.]